jgi:hypothetical protein
MRPIDWCVDQDPVLNGLNNHINFYSNLFPLGCGGLTTWGMESGNVQNVQTGLSWTQGWSVEYCVCMRLSEIYVFGSLGIAQWSAEDLGLCRTATDFGSIFTQILYRRTQISSEKRQFSDKGRGGLSTLTRPYFLR